MLTAVAVARDTESLEGFVHRRMAHICQVGDLLDREVNACFYQ